MPVEADCPLVGGPDEEVHPHRSLLAQCAYQRVHQLPSQSSRLQPRQQVDVQVRGVVLGELVRDSRRNMDKAGRTLIRRPPIRRKLGWWRRVPVAQCRPPVGLQPLLKSLAVQSSDYVAADADIILSDEGQRWLEQRVGSGEDVAQDPLVTENRRGVLASVTCPQADPVQVI